MEDVKEVPKSFPHAAINARKARDRAAYLYAMWHAILALHARDGHIDDDLANHFSLEFYRLTESLSALLTWLETDDPPF